MEKGLNQEAKVLYDKANQIVHLTDVLKANRKDEKLHISIPEDFREAFLNFVDKVVLRLMEENNDFYGYFLFQMGRDIRFDLSSPTAVHFKGTQYILHFNPILFLNLTIKQMQTSIRHEIYHILSLHLIRAKELKGKYSTLAINMAMDLVVNQYLEDLPPYAVTIDQLGVKYGLKLKPYESFEYYAEKIELALDLEEEDEEDGEIVNYDPEKTHDVWEEHEALDETTLRAFTEKAIDEARRGELAPHLENMISALKNNKEELPWNVYLNRLMGRIQSQPKKTITRRNRRQPERMDLRGTLRSYKADIAVALDISGSISDAEFIGAMKEVLSIVQNYKYEITIIECDDQIRRVYKVKTQEDLKERLRVRGGTHFSPVFEYANTQRFDFLIYFTDGKGEQHLKIRPMGYPVLWVLSGNADKLSLKESYGMIKKLGQIKTRDQEVDMSDVRNDGYSMNHQEPIL